MALWCVAILRVSAGPLITWALRRVVAWLHSESASFSLDHVALRIGSQEIEFVKKRENGVKRSACHRSRLNAVYSRGRVRTSQAGFDRTHASPFLFSCCSVHFFFFFNFRERWLNATVFPAFSNLNSDLYRHYLSQWLHFLNRHHQCSV